MVRSAQLRRDEDLERRIARLLDEGDRRAAAAEAVRGYRDAVLRYLMQLCQDVDAAQEVFARTCEKLWKGIAGYRRECAMATWLHHLAWNATRDYLREARHRRERRLATTEAAKVAAEVRVSTARFLKSAARDRLAKLKQSLDVEDRSLLVLRIERQLSFKQIAEVMSEPGRPLDEGTVRKRFERLKNRLRRLAEAEGLLDS
ncbi:MAG TPA: RNA polymerase sigma factor [Haliangiales bacterium]|nr:RNA polymerase sigma factor [Haliangiales bacterium]